MNRLELPDFDNPPEVRRWTLQRIDANTRKVRWLAVSAVALAVAALVAGLSVFGILFVVYAVLSLGFAVAFHRIAGLYESVIRMMDDV